MGHYIHPEKSNVYIWVIAPAELFVGEQGWVDKPGHCERFTGPSGSTVATAVYRPQQCVSTQAMGGRGRPGLDQVHTNE